MATGTSTQVTNLLCKPGNSGWAVLSPGGDGHVDGHGDGRRTWGTMCIVANLLQAHVHNGRVIVACLLLAELWQACCSRLS